MTKRHDDIFDAVLSGHPVERGARDEKDRTGARFLKRGNAISERLSGQHEEKTLHWVDPARCRMWARHNRDYDLLTPENCSDLIEGIRAQGKQEFPAIVRRVEDSDYEFEVICGARRHFAVTWLRTNNYPQFNYLVEVRDLSDEEAFRLADIENRDREDISDYERAVDYAAAVDLYYGGKQKAMAERLEVSEVWLSRYLELARLPAEVVQAFPTSRDIKELHARTLKPFLKDVKTRSKILTKAKALADLQAKARNGHGAFLEGAKVVAQLKSAAVGQNKAKTEKIKYNARTGGPCITVKRKGPGNGMLIDVPAGVSRTDLEALLDQVLKGEY
ncbi:MAG: ParB/RepB/Spo0J family partition protein [Pseudomonadota bacterium]